MYLTKYLWYKVILIRISHWIGDDYGYCCCYYYLMCTTNSRSLKHLVGTWVSSKMEINTSVPSNKMTCIYPKQKSSISLLNRGIPPVSRTSGTHCVTSSTYGTRISKIIIPFPLPPHETYLLNHPYQAVVQMSTIPHIRVPTMKTPNIWKIIEIMKRNELMP